jgi:hypothetical protein
MVGGRADCRRAAFVMRSNLTTKGTATPQRGKRQIVEICRGDASAMWESRNDLSIEPLRMLPEPDARCARN